MVLFFCMINILNIYNFYLPFWINYLQKNMHLFIHQDIELLLVKNNYVYEKHMMEKNKIQYFVYIFEKWKICISYNTEIHNYFTPALEVNFYIKDIYFINDKIFFDDFFDVYEDIGLDKFCFEFDEKMIVHKNIFDVRTFIKDFQTYYTHDFVNYFTQIDKELIQEEFENNQSLRKTIYYMMYVYYISHLSLNILENQLQSEVYNQNDLVLQKKRWEIITSFWYETIWKFRQYIEIFFSFLSK